MDSWLVANHFNDTIILHSSFNHCAIELCVSASDSWLTSIFTQACYQVSILIRNVGELQRATSAGSTDPLWTVWITQDACASGGWIGEMKKLWMFTWRLHVNPGPDITAIHSQIKSAHASLIRKRRHEAWYVQAVCDLTFAARQKIGHKVKYCWWKSVYHYNHLCPLKGQVNSKMSD